MRAPSRWGLGLTRKQCLCRGKVPLPLNSVIHLWMTWPRKQIPERISPSLGALCSAHPAQLYVVTSRRMLPVFNSRRSLSPVPCSFTSKPEELLQGSRTHGRSPESPVWLSSVARA